MTFIYNMTRDYILYMVHLSLLNVLILLMASPSTVETFAIGLKFLFPPQGLVNFLFYFMWSQNWSWRWDDGFIRVVYEFFGRILEKIKEENGGFQKVLFILCSWFSLSLLDMKWGDEAMYVIKLIHHMILGTELIGRFGIFAWLL